MSTRWSLAIFAAVVVYVVLFVFGLALVRAGRTDE